MPLRNGYKAEPIRGTVTVTYLGKKWYVAFGGVAPYVTYSDKPMSSLENIENMRVNDLVLSDDAKTYLEGPLRSKGGGNVPNILQTKVPYRYWENQTFSNRIKKFVGYLLARG